MKIQTFFQGGFASNTYVLTSQGEAAIIDPSVEYDELIKAYGNNVPHFKYIILTHVHFDHMLEINTWKEKTGATVLVGKDAAPSLSDPYLNLFRPFLRKNEGYYGEYKTVSEGSVIKLGEESLTVLDTPGHACGAIALYGKDMCIVGDTVFAYGALGRTDLPGSNGALLLESLKKIISLPDNTVIYPGHGEPSMVKYLKNIKI